MKRHFKQFLALLILAATVAAFVYYFVHNPAAWQRLGTIPPLTLALLFGLYLCMTGTIALILLATVSLCNARIAPKDGVVLTMWSSIINFFGPLQSGPAFRAVYLKKRYGISLKQYGLATLLYYGFFALFNGVCLISGIFPWYALVSIAAGLLLGGGLLLRSRLPLAQKLRSLPLQQAYKLALATLLQVLLTIVIYTIELQSINPHITLAQAITYTGAANFALFVSITPGAIGFREAFLVFSEKLHHISAATILTANLVDRALYVSLLAVLFVIALSIHAQQRLSVKADT